MDPLEKQIQKINRLKRASAVGWQEYLLLLVAVLVLALSFREKIIATLGPEPIYYDDAHQFQVGEPGR